MCDFCQITVGEERHALTNFSVKIWWKDPTVMSNSPATSRTVKTKISTNHSTNSPGMVAVRRCGRSSRPGIFTDRHSALFKKLKTLIALSSARTVLSVCLVKQFKCLCKIFTKFAAKFHTHTHTHKYAVPQALVTNPTNSLWTCSVQRMKLDE
jgi:hypothetical protein